MRYYCSTQVYYWSVVTTIDGVFNTLVLHYRNQVKNIEWFIILYAMHPIADTGTSTHRLQISIY